MKLIFVGADHEVTGSCHFLQACGKNILVDYGMEQGIDTFENVPLPVPEANVDYVFLTMHISITRDSFLFFMREVSGDRSSQPMPHAIFAR